MGNCLSKLHLQGQLAVKHVNNDRKLGKTSSQTLNFLNSIGVKVTSCRKKIITPVEDRFPRQACNLDFEVDNGITNKSKFIKQIWR